MAAFKVPSINSMIGGALATLKRFPITVLCALTGAGILIYLTHTEWRHTEVELEIFLDKVLMCCALGLSLFLAFALMSEARQHSKMQKVIWQVVALVLLTVYFFTLRNPNDRDIVQIARYFLYIITVHLFVSFAPFVGNNRLNGFWQYNKTLFLRFLLAGLYTCVLYGGIALALWSIDELLHITINYKKYMYVWYLLACVFNTVFFLAGVPSDIDELENDTSYLKGLKVFTQYVLLPLVALYLLILYIYIGKILVEWKLPKGLVSYLVIGYSVAGIFSLLLVYPIRHNDENRWIKIFSRWFYLALFPLIIMLSISIFNRVADYGITENRYFILVLALWLFGIATYFVSGSKENIKIIPISLCLIAFLTSFGPWGAFSVSRHSQVYHLEKLLEKDKILIAGKIDNKNKHEVTSDESEEINSVMEYLDESNSLYMVQPWFSTKVDTLKYGKVYALLNDMHLESQNEKDWRTLYLERQSPTKEYTSLYSVDVKGFDKFSTFYGYYGRAYDTAKRDTVAIGWFMIGVDSFGVFPDRTNNTWVLKRNHKTLAPVDIKGMCKKFELQYDTTRSSSYQSIYIPADKFYMDVEGDSMTMRFIFKSITLEVNQDKMRIGNLDAEVLTKFK